MEKNGQGKLDRIPISWAWKHASAKRKAEAGCIVVALGALCAVGGMKAMENQSMALTADNEEIAEIIAKRASVGGVPIETVVVDGNDIQLVGDASNVVLAEFSEKVREGDTSISRNPITGAVTYEAELDSGTVKVAITEKNDTKVISSVQATMTSTQVEQVQESATQSAAVSASKTVLTSDDGDGAHVADGWVSRAAKMPQAYSMPKYSQEVVKLLAGFDLSSSVNMQSYLYAIDKSSSVVIPKGWYYDDINESAEADSERHSHQMAGIADGSIAANLDANGDVLRSCYLHSADGNATLTIETDAERGLMGSEDPYTAVCSLASAWEESITSSATDAGGDARTHTSEQRVYMLKETGEYLYTDMIRVTGQSTITDYVRVAVCNPTTGIVNSLTLRDNITGGEHSDLASADALMALLIRPDGFDGKAAMEAMNNRIVALYGDEALPASYKEDLALIV